MIPADLRGDFPAIARRAQAQGMKVSPALRLAFAGTAALAPRRQQQNPTDAWATAAVILSADRMEGGWEPTLRTLLDFPAF